MNIRPLADRVLIKPAAAEEKTLGGIIIPDSAKEKPLKGEIVAVGNGTKDEEMVVKVGDNVLYGKYDDQTGAKRYVTEVFADTMEMLTDRKSVV